MSYETWLNVVKQIADPATRLPIASPEVDGAPVCFRYICNPDTRIGYLIAWCSSTKRGIHISRVRAPSHVEIVPMNSGEAADRGIPNDIQFVNPEG